MEDMLAKAMTMGGAGLGLAQKLMTSIRADKPGTLDSPEIADRPDRPDAPVVPPNGRVDSIKD